MRELSLFTGAGGGLLGTLLLGWTPVGYVEWDAYCQRVLRARIDDGYIPNAPIYGDIRAFLTNGYAAAYTGLVDVVTGGFPCQPFSIAGKRNGADDHRNMWPATIECIRVVRPRYAFLENVPGLLSSGYFGTILGDLAESGYDVRWRVLSAAEVGAPHKRKRLWIAAHANAAQWRADGPPRAAAGRSAESAWTGNAGGAGELDVADAVGLRCQADYRGRSLRDADGDGARPLRRHEQQPGAGGERADVPDADRAGRQEQRRTGSAGAQLTAPERAGWWEVEPAVGGTPDGLALELDGARADEWRSI